ncbi:MAG: transglutaminase domain-containing protein [Candidatus Sumerlaeia bacterium]
MTSAPCSKSTLSSFVNLATRAIIRAANRAAGLLFFWTLISPGVCQMGLIPPVDVAPRIKELEQAGQFQAAAREITIALKSVQPDSPEAYRLRYELDRLNRIRLDFNLTRDDILSALRQEIPDVTPADLDRWEQDGTLEMRLIEGEKRYFNRAIRNLFRLNSEARERRGPTPTPAPGTRDTQRELFDHMARVARAAKSGSSPYVLPERFHVAMTIEVNADTVPSTATLRCWMPLPRECELNRDITILNSDPPIVKIAPPDHPQRSVYFEQPARAGRPTRFHLEYEFTAVAFWREIDPAAVKPYDTNSPLYRTWTAERPLHLSFTPGMRRLAAEIVGDETNPYLKAQKIFTWINDNIRYTSALEYSTIMNLSEYCAENRRGDCGIQSLLFIVLCRISGIPARWESGWYCQPGRTNMHDWAQFYIEPYGWLWADPSRGFLPDNAPQDLKMFYFGNVDGYRLAANQDYSVVFDPPKRHFRSEPVDFQRGEVEWEGGNLYFDQWDYEMKITPVRSSQTD